MATILVAGSLVPADAAPGDIRRSLPGNKKIDRERWPQGRRLVSTPPFYLDAGESRLVYGRLRARNGSHRSAEQQVGLGCDGTLGGVIRTSRNNEGRDRRYPDGWGTMTIDARYLFTAVTPGTYICSLWGKSSTDALTALARRTYINVAATGDRSDRQWLERPCDSKGRVRDRTLDPYASHCEYLVHRRVKQRGTAYANSTYALVEDSFVVPPGTRHVQVLADLQLTTCYQNTASCIDSVDQYGGRYGGVSVVDSRLEAWQLDASGGTSLCGKATFDPAPTPGSKFTRTRIASQAHHWKLRHRLTHNVSSAPGCTGRFLFRLSVRAVAGDPVKLVGRKAAGLIDTRLAFSNAIARAR